MPGLNNGSPSDRRARRSGPATQPRRSSLSGKGRRVSGSGLNLAGSRSRRLEAREVIILIALAAIIILLLVLIVNGIRGCVAGQSTTPVQETQVEAEKEQPAVSEKVSQDLAAALTTRLDQDNQIATIARDADKFGSEDLVYLALEEPSAVSFVASYPTASKEAHEYSEKVTKGTVPKLYTYDSRWGYVDFAGNVFALTGSAPTCVAMAYMGLTGSTTRTPNALADLATSSNYVDASGVTSAFFDDGVNSINGLACTQQQTDITSLSNTLANGNVMVVKLPANSPFGSFQRYILVVSETENGAMVVHDPLSAENSNHEWAAGTIADAAEAMYSISATDTPVDEGVETE